MTRTINQTFHRFTAPLPKDRVRRLKISAAAWAIGTVLITTLWVVNQWQANGALESFGHEGDPGEWNPTLWAVIVGVWGLIVGIQALRVYFERHGRLERLKYDVSAWLLGMAVITPLWALIEWQDNGAFERWSNDSLPGDWEPWFLYVGGIWALVIAFRAVRAWLDRDFA
jgi:hypothetical protein